MGWTSSGAQQFNSIVNFDSAPRALRKYGWEVRVAGRRRAARHHPRRGEGGDGRGYGDNRRAEGHPVWPHPGFESDVTRERPAENSTSTRIPPRLAQVLRSRVENNKSTIARDRPRRGRAALVAASSRRRRPGLGASTSSRLAAPSLERARSLATRRSSRRLVGTLGPRRRCRRVAPSHPEPARLARHHHGAPRMRCHYRPGAPRTPRTCQRAASSRVAPTRTAPHDEAGRVQGDPAGVRDSSDPTSGVVRTTAGISGGPQHAAGSRPEDEINLMPFFRRRVQGLRRPTGRGFRTYRRVVRRVG